MEIEVMAYEDIECFDTEKCCIMHLIERLGEQAKSDYFLKDTITLINMREFYQYLIDEYAEEATDTAPNP